MPIVEARAVSVAFGEVSVLREASLTVAAGEIVAVSGVNGCGKSTLLRCVSGLLRPSGGEVRVLGAAPTGTPAFWRDVALVAEEPAWYPGLTVREHLELVPLTHGRDDGRVMSVARALDEFELAGRADATPLTLSSGQRQRLALASVLVRPSRLLLLDEPEQKLDAAFRARLAALLRAYAQTGGTIVLATHDAALAAGAGARVLPMRDGRLSGGDPHPAAAAASAS
ncbi:heme ABC exporter ATP-binding protein CcmA [Catellatospora sp. NPDC049609]|uniref:heme ABC exporter ATP-binding protein CcmA n=1 Tax=Catellatospora sp. NPDC049609 TaxID=3155505 RepID=UPI0034375B9B